MKLRKYFALVGFSVIIRNAIMAYYATQLAVSRALLCKSINTSPISRYLCVAASLSCLAQMTNPTIVIICNRLKLSTYPLHESKRL